MSKRFLVLLVLLIIPAIACNLTSDDEEPTPRPNQPAIVVTATQGNPTPTLPSAFPSATPTTSSNNNSNNNNNNSGVVNPSLSSMSFSTTAAGANITAFPAGTQRVYLRFNYSGVPIGTTMNRYWYRDGVQFTSNSDDWSAAWGTSGRLTHINYSTTSGLPAGNYRVVVDLPAYGERLEGTFSVSAVNPTFSNLNFSRTPTGTAMTTFPYGTEEVYSRWDYANVPSGAVVIREWYLNGVQIIDREEAWRAEWGTNGTVRNIRNYNFVSGYGLEPGNYQVIIYLRDFPTARVEGSFTIEGNLGPRFSNLRFASSANGSPTTTFPAGTEEVFAIWDYANIPNQAQMRRIWKRDGTTIIDRTEVWDFNKYGTSGTVRDVSLFDRVNGLASGTYDVTISVVGQPGVQVSGTFTIGQPAPNPIFSNVTFGTSADSPPMTTFDAGTPQITVRWDYANIPSGSTMRMTWTNLNDGSSVVLTSLWTDNSSGSTHFDFVPGAPFSVGQWSVRLELDGYPSSVTTGSFTVQAQSATLENLIVTSVPGGPAVEIFPMTVTEMYAAFDFSNVSPGTTLRTRLVSLSGTGIDRQVSQAWPYVADGRVTDLRVVFEDTPLPPGNYRLTVSLPDQGAEASTTFSVVPAP